MRGVHPGKLLTSSVLMRSNLIRIVFVATAVLMAMPEVAHAQIYSWRDAAGNLVLSDRPKTGGERTYAVGTTGDIRTTRPARRNTTYDSIISEHASFHGVRADLVHAVIHAESAFNPMARSIKGAMGLMQLMPATASQYRVSNPYDPVENIRAGVAYLRSLLERYSQNEELALAAYNAGPTAVKKYGAVPPYRETRNYVAKIRNEAGARPAPTRVYKVVEFKDGREIIRYTNTPPSNKPNAVNAPIR
jgi:soluble lytic murein transglycosylase-like protein